MLVLGEGGGGGYLRVFMRIDTFKGYFLVYIARGYLRVFMSIVTFKDYFSMKRGYKDLWVT